MSFLEQLEKEREAGRAEESVNTERGKARADAAVLEGMPRAQAYEFAAQAVLGSAKLVLESGKHPGELKDMVCSPGGTTIEAVRVLEDSGFRGAVIEATKACIDKARAL